MNNVAILPKTIMYLLQNQNVKREVAKKAQTMPSTSVPVVADATAPPIIPSASASASVSEEAKSTEVGGTSISELLNTTTA
jgi:hypothetical protein